MTCTMCWPKDSRGEAIHEVVCAAGHNIGWLVRAIARLKFRMICYFLPLVAFIAQPARKSPTQEPLIAGNDMGD